MPGEQWTPSNGTEMDCFTWGWCRRCARDKAMREGEPLDECDDNELCEILAAAFRGEAVEWRELEDGKTVCLAFVEADQPVPPPRCTRTMELFPFDPASPNEAPTNASP